MDAIRVRHLDKSFGDKAVLRDFSADFPAGAVTAVMAPSGGGKTTLLRILMGLERADGGTVTGLSGLRQSAVFQEDRLCENLSAASNLRLTNPNLSLWGAEEALAAVGLAGCGGQSVAEFSGGMRRRVAILRALLAPWDVLFLDEPFKGLDAEMKAMVMADTCSRCRGRTVLLVTHDPDEAAALGAVQVLQLPDLQKRGH